MRCLYKNNYIKFYIMEDNLSVLVDAKTEYTKQLTIFSIHIYDGIKSIYDETTRVL